MNTIENNPPLGSVTVQRHGLLDIKIVLSNSEPTAGNPFAVHLLVTNLFDVPIYLRSINVSLPSELLQVFEADGNSSIEGLPVLLEQVKKGSAPILFEPKSFLGKLTNTKHTKIRNALSYMVTTSEELDKELQSIQDQINLIKQKIESLTFGKSLSEKLELIKNDETLRHLSQQEAEYSKKADLIRDRITNLTTQIVTMTGSTAIIANGNLSIENIKSTKVFIQTSGNLTIESMSSEVALEKSWSATEPLQPGNTAVSRIIIKTNNTIFFRPIQYIVQYSIRFSFDELGANHLNTAQQNLTIRAPIFSVMLGSIIGGTAGYLATFLQNLSNSPAIDILTQDWLKSIILLILTVILSAMSVVFLARKSETQSLVSIEDFWGGLVIGFLVGYTGTAFFNNIAGVN
jgi:hypothetical protein